MDYFAIKQNYYSGNYVDALKEIESSHGSDSDETLIFYRSKVQLALQKYTPGTNSTRLAKLFDLYYSFLQSKDISELKAEVNEESTKPYELNILATALAILGKLDDALKYCVKGIDSEEQLGKTELLLCAVEVALLNGKFSIASTIFENYTSLDDFAVSSENELIINLAESYIKFATNKDTTGSNFYYYEELAQTFPTWKTQLGLMNLHLQQGNIVEAQGIVDLLESDYYSVNQKEAADLYKPHFLANKITLSIMQGASNTEDLKNQLADLDPEHSLIKSDKQVNAKFDEIVARYSS
ncbi:hypothetical protein KAFR_0B01250 [Kazachstania africana CBS 2517]|uniref:Coatomer subunit epsilon n=1 Tax=Kazachstania africana (strain ATCC 22294 / BCRC 22015 / CBS 2517 / CECT 1963 / NBRC 1671 / NRRL Y-8276) TaxID=1071382 RepID=H2APX4_KAZAF|nr:hypothetical protein KAFR_0B01250 [Kazachstania africana CBS 2517]CCF56424.1 hypothetical protein KAFR_0B01250 [Kazachstania africana CBS 2517]